MTWTFSVVDKRQQDDVLLLTIEASDGTRVYRKVFRCTSPSLEYVRGLCRAWTANLDAVTSTDHSIGIGELRTTEDPPTKEQLAADAFFAKFVLLKAVLIGVQLGIIPTNDPRITSLREWLTANVKTEYLSDMRWG
jgi:hypothetical protein